MEFIFQYAIYAFYDSLVTEEDCQKGIHTYPVNPETEDNVQMSLTLKAAAAAKTADKCYL